MKRNIRGIALIVFIAVACGSFYSVGYLVGQGSLYRTDTGEIRLTNRSSKQPKDVDFGLFWQVWNIVDSDYVGKADKQERVYGAISGMLNSIGDPYTVFMKPNDSEQFQEDLSGSFEGIGAEIAMKKSQLIIVSPLEGSPAQKAGLKPQDVIVAIDDDATEEMGLSEAVQKIRGKAGTTVKLTIVHEGVNEPKEYKIQRDKITVSSVKWEIKPGNIGYIKISQFGDDTTQLMRQAADEMTKKQVKAIIVDVRNDPGGLLTEAINVTSLFINPGTVVQRKYKDGRTIEDHTTESPLLKSPKLVVLINGGSASASEIFAGAIQDYKRGVLIGEKTFGKGSVQDMESLPGGAAVKITTAKWLTAKGRVVDGKGIEPDIKVEMKEDSQNDPQLERALKEAAGE